MRRCPREHWSGRGSSTGRTFFGHPLGLANLAGVEMWERFSFYGMQAILVYYLYSDLTKGGLGLPQGTATSIVGAYGGLVYLSAILGAWVADRLLGAERTLLVAAVGMALGLTQYLLLRRRTLAGAGRRIVNPLDRRGKVRYGSAALVVVLPGVALFAVILTSAKITAGERSRVVSFVPMFVASAVFWSLLQQQSTVVAVYADERLDRDIVGWTMPPSLVQSINPVFIIVFAGGFSALWTRLGDRQPPTPVKFARGTLFMGVAFLLFLPFVARRALPLTRGAVAVDQARQPPSTPR